MTKKRLVKDPIQEFTITQISSKLKLQMKRLDLLDSCCKNGQIYDKKYGWTKCFNGYSIK